MAKDIEWYEEAAASENDWVRAVILKPDHVAREDAFRVATRARDMARRALGDHHPAYAIALLNLGLYYDIIQNDVRKAKGFFAQAREILGENHNAIAEAIYWLGIFHYEVKEDFKRAETLFDQSVTVWRETPDSDPLQIADALICLAAAKFSMDKLRESIPVLKEALKIQSALLPPSDSRLLDTADRLAGVLSLVSDY